MSIIDAEISSPNYAPTSQARRVTIPTEIEDLQVKFIEVGETRRPLNQAIVDDLALSFETIGLMTPISVQYFSNRPGADGGSADSVILIAGAHRLAAAKQLGWETITCAMFGETVDPDHVRLWEITENLKRSDLTALERSEQQAEWLKLTNKLAHVEPVSKGGRGRTGGVREAARTANIPRATAERAEKISSISPKAKQAARDAGIDRNQSALLKVAQEPAERQVERVAELAKPKASRSRREDLTATIMSFTEQGQAATLPEDVQLQLVNEMGTAELLQVFKAGEISLSDSVTIAVGPQDRQAGGVALCMLSESNKRRSSDESMSRVLQQFWRMASPDVRQAFVVEFSEQISEAGHAVAS